TFGAERRDLMAALDRTTGAVLPWDAHFKPTFRIVDDSPVDETQGFVGSLAASTNAIYVDGGFDTVGGVSRLELAALVPTTGPPLDWAPETYGGFFDVSQNDVLLAGIIPFLAPIPTNGLARVPPAPPLHSAPTPPLPGAVFTL